MFSYKVYQVQQPITVDAGIFDNAYQGVYTDLHRNAWTADRYAGK